MSRFCAGAAFAAAFFSAACGKSPQPPSTGSPSGPIAIRGTERLTWDQPAVDTQELATIAYAVYIDNASRVVLSAACATTAGAAGYECRAPIPPMNPGAHTLEVASFYQTDPAHESARSNQIQVTLTATTAVVTESAGSARSESAGIPERDRASRQSASAKSAAEEPTPWPSNAVRIAEALDTPSDLAFTPDGRLWIAERGGRVRVVDNGTLVPQPALTIENGSDGSARLLALAADPQFSRNHFLYALYTARSRAGGMNFSIARFREASDTLADRVVILDNVEASPDPHGALRFGPDGKLYAAFDEGGDERLAGDAASFNGKILRLNADGTTPDDSPRKSPVRSIGADSPRGLTWNRSTGRLWDADRSRVGPVLWTPEPLALDALENDLFIASGAGLVRATIDPKNPGRFAATAAVVSDVSVRAVAVAPDGGLYFATADAVGLIAR